ncbi:NAD(P)/FAD-dependent oxidoreductase [Jatrophihabitans sp. DSM 45814]
MNDSESFVVLGASLAGAKAAEALRDLGFAGELILIGAENQLPYERPPLSKGYLAGKAARGDAFVHPKDWYSDHDVDLRLATQAVSLDRTARVLSLADGSTLGYDKLLLATGSNPRTLTLPGAEARSVHYLRTIDQSEALKASFGQKSSLVVIGAGWIGLEVAATAREAGLEVTVIESAELPLLTVLGPEVAAVFAELHRQHGVDLRLGASLAEILTEDGRASGVRLADGSTVDADLVLIAIGARPNTELAEAAGLEVDNGVVVDASLTTSDPNIFAAGDVANAFHPLFGKHIRVEHWANALKQPATAAAAMLGQVASYDELPYFFTDQFDLGMEYVGYVEPGGYDRVVFRGNVERREFIAFWLADNRVLAGMNVNVWDVTDSIKQLITSRVIVDPARLADSEVPLDEVEPG